MTNFINPRGNYTMEVCPDTKINKTSVSYKITMRAKRIRLCIIEKLKKDMQKNNLSLILVFMILDLLL